MVTRKDRHEKVGPGLRVLLLFVRIWIELWSWVFELMWILLKIRTPLVSKCRECRDAVWYCGSEVLPEVNAKNYADDLA